ncbi:hypothetical protein FKK32_29675, partial [Klebsiella pneumoniae]|nr:hypothetical protein [Klebsiella pneumoniae]
MLDQLRFGEGDGLDSLQHLRQDGRLLFHVVIHCKLLWIDRQEPESDMRDQGLKHIQCVLRRHGCTGIGRDARLQQLLRHGAQLQLQALKRFL